MCPLLRYPINAESLLHELIPLAASNLGPETVMQAVATEYEGGYDRGEEDGEKPTTHHT